MASREQLVDHLQALALAELRSAARVDFAELQPERHEGFGKPAEDGTLVSLAEPHDFRRRAKALGLTEEKLRIAIRNACSNSLEKVREYLAAHGKAD